MTYAVALMLPVLSFAIGWCYAYLKRLDGKLEALCASLPNQKTIIVHDRLVDQGDIDARLSELEGIVYDLKQQINNKGVFSNETK